MRRMAGAAVATVVMFVVGGVSASWAQTTTTQSTTTTSLIVETVVTVEPGPGRTQVFAPPCNDIAIQFEERLSFVVRRTGAVTSPLTVTYRLSGSAQPGVHFEPLPGTVTFQAGSGSAIVEVVARQTPRGALVDLTLEVTGGTPLAPPSPPSARIQFVSPFPSGPIECGYRFTPDPWNTAQTVVVGGTLRALTLQQVTPPLLSPATGTFRVVGGALPVGVELRGDGSFGGAPTMPGVFGAQIEACRPAPPGTCVTTDFTVTVLSAQGLPRTGPGTVTRWLTIAGWLTFAGLSAIVLGAPTVRTSEPARLTTVGRWQRRGATGRAHPTSSPAGARTARTRAAGP